MQYQEFSLLVVPFSKCSVHLTTASWVVSEDTSSTGVFMLTTSLLTVFYWHSLAWISHNLSTSILPTVICSHSSSWLTNPQSTIVFGNAVYSITWLNIVRFRRCYHQSSCCFFSGFIYIINITHIICVLCFPILYLVEIFFQSASKSRILFLISVFLATWSILKSDCFLPGPLLSFIKVSLLWFLSSAWMGCHSSQLSAMESAGRLNEARWPFSTPCNYPLQAPFSRKQASIHVSQPATLLSERHIPRHQVFNSNGSVIASTCPRRISICGLVNANF